MILDRCNQFHMWYTVLFAILAMKWFPVGEMTFEDHGRLSAYMTSY